MEPGEQILRTHDEVSILGPVLAEHGAGMAQGTKHRADSTLVAMGERLRAARARARIPDQAEWAAPRRRSVGRRGIARDDLVAYVAYRSGLELDGSTVARWESAQHRPRPIHIRAVVAALADLDAFAEQADAEAIIQLAQAGEGSADGRLDLSRLTTVAGPRRSQPTIGVLLALEQDVVEASYVLAAPTTVLGRGSDADVTISELAVGRRHAAIDRRPDYTWVLRDLGSRTGTWLNGALLLKPTRLLAGDLIRLGSAASFRFELRSWPAAAPPRERPKTDGA